MVVSVTNPGFKKGKIHPEKRTLATETRATTLDISSELCTQLSYATIFEQCSIYYIASAETTENKFSRVRSEGEPRSYLRIHPSKMSLNTKAP